jgi:soluble cytochrome b562
MDRVGKAFRKLRKQVADPAQNESSLQLIATMQAAAKEALQFNPAKADDLPADQRPKFDEDFRAGVNQLLDKLSALKDTVAAGKNDEAAKMVADIIDFEKKEHKEFRRPEKD